MPKKTSQKSDGNQYNPPNDVDRHCCWLFVACKIGQSNEDTLEFVLMLREACNRAAEQIAREHPDKPVNAIPFLSGHLAQMADIHRHN